MLELKQINKSFNGQPVLVDINVTIEDGKTLANCWTKRCWEDNIVANH
ncbi:Glutamine transport ATP-binding protein GlnQ [Lacticaseibacillus paracasei subsp. paracasei Lpp70]|nr:Glutamine transport ATP-binding protein GlnQ [Lacticaseibacillus paracasei subsp. paracasei Lpp70]